MRAKVYIGAKKYAVYIGKKIIEKTLEFLTLPSKFISNKTQFLKNITIFGHSVQNGTPTPDIPIPVESVGNKTSNLFDGEWEYGNIDANGNVIISTSPTAWIHGKNRIKVKPDTRYWFRFFGDVTRTSAQFYIIGYDKDDKFITGKRVSVGNIIQNVNGSYYDMASNVEYIRLFYYHDVEESTSLDTDRYKLSIEERNDIIPSYEPYGYKVPVEVSGKNLLNIQKFQPSFSGSFPQNIKLKAGNYYLSAYNEDGTTDGIVGGSTFSMGLYDGTGTKIRTSNVRYGFTLTEDEAEKLVSIRFNWAPTYYTGVSEYINVQLEEGTQATPYQSYIEPTTTNIYLPEPLRNLGNYIDTMSIVGKNINITRNINRIKISDLTWSERTDIGTGFFTSILNDRSFESDSVSLIECYTYASTVGSALDGYTKNDKSMTFYYRLDSPSRNIYIKDTDVTTVDELLKKVENYYLYYQLLLPKIETYTIDTPIQLEQGNLTININTNVQPTKTMITGDIDNDN